MEGSEHSEFPRIRPACKSGGELVAGFGQSVPGMTFIVVRKTIPTKPTPFTDELSEFVTL